MKRVSSKNQNHLSTTVKESHEPGKLNGRETSFTTINLLPPELFQQALIPLLHFNDSLYQLPLQDLFRFATSSKTIKDEWLQTVFHRIFPDIQLPEDFSKFYSNFTHQMQTAVKYLVDGNWNQFPYCLLDNKARTLAAKLAFQKEGKFKNICKSVICFQQAAPSNRTHPITEIKSEEVCIEIAKIVAAQYGWETSEYIQNYGITDEKALIEIAKIAAAESGWGTSKHIKKYGINDESALIEIAIIAAAQNGEGTLKYLKNYGIADEYTRIEIAMITAAQNGWRTSKYIQNYEITSDSKRIEIAKIAAAQDGYGTSKYIKKYGIKDKGALIDIAKIAAAQNGEGTLKYLKNYGITDEKALIEIKMISFELF